MLPYRVSLPLLALLLIALAGELAFLDWRQHQPKESPYDPIIVEVSRETGVDPFLIRALIWRESHFDALTYGLAQEHGLMQVTPEVGEEWARVNHIANFQPSDLFDPVTNIRAGTWYLNLALAHWSEADDPTPFALAEYNAGRSNALKWVDPQNPQDHLAFMQRITYPTTRKYVEVIIEKRDQYHESLRHNRWYRDFENSDAASTQLP